MKSTRRRQVHYRYRGHANRKGMKRWYRQVSIPGHMLAWLEPRAVSPHGLLKSSTVLEGDTNG